MKHIKFTVVGVPKPAGSKTAFAIKKGGVYTGRTVVMDACKKTKSWQAIVKAKAKLEAPETPFVGPISVEFIFYMPRPKSHFGTGKKLKQLKPTAPDLPTGRPDLLKLARAVEDAMTGIVYVDDSQIVVEVLRKRYVDDEHFEGVKIEVLQMKKP